MNKPKTRILVIDDEKDLCFFLKANLEARGAYNVRTATSAVKGVKMVRRFKPDLVILDILMPGADGFNVLRTMKEDNKTVHIPVLMLSALNDTKSKVEAARLYCEDYMSKPVPIDDLRKRVEKILKLWKRPS